MLSSTNLAVMSKASISMFTGCSSNSYQGGLQHHKIAVKELKINSMPQFYSMPCSTTKNAALHSLTLGKDDWLPATIYMGLYTHFYMKTNRQRKGSVLLVNSTMYPFSEHTLSYYPTLCTVHDVLHGILHAHTVYSDKNV